MLSTRLTLQPFNCRHMRHYLLSVLCITPLSHEPMRSRVDNQSQVEHVNKFLIGHSKIGSSKHWPDTFTCCQRHLIWARWDQLIRFFRFLVHGSTLLTLTWRSISQSTWTRPFFTCPPRAFINSPAIDEFRYATEVAYRVQTETGKLNLSSDIGPVMPT